MTLSRVDAIGRVYTIKDPEERFWALVDVRGEDECWPWLGTPNSGRGRFYITTGTYVLPYHFTFVTKKGKIPDHHDVHHTCFNEVCCNPRHLQAKDKTIHNREHALLRRRSAEGLFEN